jgi:bifunctional DNase/RNase
MLSRGGINPWLVGALVAACGVAAASQMAASGKIPLWDDPDDADSEVELVVHEVMRCANGQAVLVLREKGGERRLPMAVGPSEASAIDRRLHGEKPERPRLQELAGQTVAALGGRVTRAEIETQTADKVFLGHLTIAGRAGEVRLESRAADSVALALDAGAPIMVARSLFDRAGIDPGSLDSGQNAKKARTSRNPPPAPVHRI